MRLTKAILALAASSAASIAVAAAAVAPASAAQASPRPIHPADTIQCQTWVTCVTPRLYQSGLDELALQADRGNGKPVIMAHYDDTSPRQDWVWTYVGQVGVDDASYGLTHADDVWYKGDPIFQLAYMPYGAWTNYCAANVANRLRLAKCDSTSAAQAFIVAPQIGTFTAVSGEYFILSALQAPSYGMHLAAKGAYRPGTQVVFTGVSNRNQKMWDNHG